MTKKTTPYELGKIGMILWWLVSVAVIVWGAWMLLINAIQIPLSPIGEAFLPTLTESSSKLKPIGDLLQKLLTGVTVSQAKTRCVLGAALLAVGIVSMLFAKRQLIRQERRFRADFMPEILQASFTDFVYDPQKIQPDTEPLCELGLLHSYERYYSANRLQGMYRGCCVSGEEIVCGGVYGDNYSSHKVKIKGQWLAIQLNRSFQGTVILERRGSKNRLQHNLDSNAMCEINFTYEPFARAFRCYSNDPEEAARLLPQAFADRLLEMQEKYEDFSVIFNDGMLYILLRRRSFDRRLEYLLPYRVKSLEQEALRLYGPLMDFTDMLLA